MVKSEGTVFFIAFFLFVSSFNPVMIAFHSPFTFPVIFKDASEDVPRIIQRT